MRIFNRYFCRADLLLLLGDIALAILAIAGVHAVMYMANVMPANNWTLWPAQGEKIAFFVVLSFYYSDLYVIDPGIPTKELLLRLVNGFGVACLIVGTVAYFLPGLGLEDIYLFEMVSVGFGLLVWRVSVVRLLEKPVARDSILIVGTGEIARLVAEETCRRKHLGIQVAGFIDSKSGSITLSYGNHVRVSLPVFSHRFTFEAVQNAGVNRILVEAPERCSDFPAQELLTLRLKGIPIEECHTFYERLTSRIPVSDLRQSWIVLSKGFSSSRWILVSKRLIDISASVLGLLVTSPIALITVIALKLDSPGPIFFRQERAGQNERPFTLYKFRSMIQNAEKHCGPVWAAANDPRVTRVGRIMRKLRVDEIPQMINVLKGDMSVVGPRPERPFFNSQLKEKIPYYHLRFCRETRHHRLGSGHV